MKALHTNRPLAEFPEKVGTAAIYFARRCGTASTTGSPVGGAWYRRGLSY